MTNINLISTVTNIRSELQTSTAYSHECITHQCNIGKEVWIKYYNGGTLEDGTFDINGDVGIGGTPSVMLYVENDEEKYNVYRYNGILSIQRTVVGNIRHDVLTNLKDIITDLKESLGNE